jgi:putative transposase
MTYYSRDLPHWHPPGKDIFLTWRLYGSLPLTFMRRQQSNVKSTARERFRATEAELDKALNGPVWLKDPRVAKCVMDAIRRGEQELNLYGLRAFVVMPNRVHILIEPFVPLAQITHRLKGTSARTANQILGRSGQRFWQDESFDHWIRTGAEFARIKNYVEQNPVKAGLVKTPEDWPWSSATK